jgi:hypothetical protein
MDLARDIALILTSVGGTVLVPKMAGAAWRAITGRAHRQRREIDRTRASEAAADGRADNEAHDRRLAQEHASHLRRLLFEAPCVDPSTIPPWPRRSRNEEDH